MPWKITTELERTTLENGPYAISLTEEQLEELLGLAGERSMDGLRH